MHDLWLTINIIWELVLEAGAWVPLALGAWVAAVGLALRRGPTRRPSLKAALALGFAAAALAFVLIPGLTASSVAELRYVLDVLALLGMAVGVGVVVGLAAWPLLSLRKPQTV